MCINHTSLKNKHGNCLVLPVEETGAITWLFRKVRMVLLEGMLRYPYIPRKLNLPNQFIYQVLQLL